MSGYIAEAILSISSRVVVFYLVPTIEIAENITRGWERGRGGGGGGGGGVIIHFRLKSSRCSCAR